MKYQHLGLVVLLFCSLSGCDVLGFGHESIGKRKDLVEEVNKLRGQQQRCGNVTMPAVNPVRWNDTLADAAWRHSKDIATHRLGGHIGSDGSGPERRVEETGYAAAAVGEIVAVGSDDRDAVLKGWLQSAGHCFALMSPAFTEAGGAMAGSGFWTVTFAAPQQSGKHLPLADIAPQK